MDYKPLPIGIDNFEMLIQRGYYFLDKSLLIKELLDKKGDTNLFTRPRRFGKTLNISMLRYFFEDARDLNGNKIEHSSLFNGLEIMQAGEKYLAHMGQYPIINLSLKSAKQPTFDLAYLMLIRQIAGEYERHSFILEHLALQDQKERYSRIMCEKGGIGDYVDALFFLSKCLYKYYNKKVIILIDEYDVPLENAFLSGFYPQMVDFIRSLFESALKSNEYLEFAVITGCLRISKESIFTGLNNLNIISILNHNFSEYFGFTEKEIKKICADYHMESQYTLFQEWYNGYIFGESNVYNPWSVIKFMYDLQADSNCFPSAYWANTSSNSIVRKLIECANDETKEEIEALIEGKSIEKPVHEDITYDEIYNTMDNLWNFMFFTGYFRKVRQRMDESTKQQYVEIMIPNQEVKYIFRTKVLSWFQEKIVEKDLTALYTALLNQDVVALEKELNELLLETISFNDAYENFYHGFIAGVLSKMKGYRVRSNREGGRGRSDLFIRPVTRRKAAYVIEFKIANSIDELDKKASEALAQIADRQYQQELYNDGYKQVVSYGISFFGKDCLVKVGAVALRQTDTR